MSQVHGISDPAFEPLRESLQSRIASGEELGASICVNIDGKNVLDIWGGHSDLAKSRAWDQDTLVPVWSCSKIVTNLAALILIDRGLLDPDEKVSKYWPEFAANGKENVKVSHILSHSSGVPAWETPITAEETFDLKLGTAKLAAQAPWWTPGEHSGYHLANQGHLVGELVHRVSGKPLQQFVADELAGSLGADFRYGLPEDLWSRTAELTKPPAISFQLDDMTSVPAKALMGTPFNVDSVADPEFRRSVNGANGGFSNARALARIGSAVTLGGIVDGDKRVFSAAALDKLQTEQVSGIDLVTGDFIRFGLGVALGDKRTRAWVPEGRVCFWGGWGGSILIMDQDRKATISYTMNRMSSTGTIGNDNTEAYVTEIYKIIEGLSA